MTTPVHLLVVAHGLWGETKHIEYICKSAAQYALEPIASNSTVPGDKTSSPIKKHKLVVLAASLSQGTLTYDGIDLCGERVVKEIDAEIEKIALDGGQVDRFSIVGYSLGGLVARYAIGILHSREPSFFDTVKPVNFATFASPAIGIPRYKSFWSGLIFWLGARLLSRSGAQLYGADRFLPSSFLDGTTTHIASNPTLLSRFSPKKKEKAASLLTVLADPQYNFFRALESFERIEIYANAVNDRTVPYPTGAIAAHDPFALARAKAVAVMKSRGEDVEEAEIDLREGGMEIHLDPDHAPLIATYAACLPPPPPSPSKHLGEKKAKKPFKLPVLLRPSSYPFSRPVSLFIIVFLPITFPASILYILCQFVLQGRSSKRRIKEIRAGLGTRQGMLERVGVKIGERVQEVVDVATGETDEPTSNGTSDSNHSTPMEERGLLKHPSLVAFASYGGTETPPLARPTSPGDKVDVGADGSLQNPYPSDPVLTPEQLIMIANLNSIPHLKKFLTYLPRSRNSHGTIVARDPVNYPPHREGMKVVDAWAQKFVV